MKSFLIKINLFASIILALFLTLEYIITQGLKKSTAPAFEKWNRLYDGKINADVLINGSSKALNQISPLIIDSILDVNSYNLGISGHDFYMQNSRYAVYLKHNKPPQLLIQIISNGTLSKRADLYHLAQFRPYLDDPIIRNTTTNYIGLTFFDYHLPFVRYFGDKKSIKEGFLSYFNCSAPIIEIPSYKGYYSYDLDWDDSFDRFVKYFPDGKTIPLTDTSIQLFKQLLIQQTSKSIVLVYPPTYHAAQGYINNRTEILALYQSLAKQHNVLLLDYSQHRLSKDNKYFYNSQHLNKKGAEIFSKELAVDIQVHFQSL